MQEAMRTHSSGADEKDLVKKEVNESGACSPGLAKTPGGTALFLTAYFVPL